jgi:hypothetical protein
MQQAKPTFRIALAMSGAISAGAYTAGVFDFLIRALAEWHARKEPDEPDVCLVAFTGASAGGVTAALGAVQLAYGLPVEADGNLRLTRLDRPAGSDPLTCVFPKLHEAWVVRPRLLGDGGEGLLTCEDLDHGGELRSALNSKVLDSIKHSALQPADNGLHSECVPFVADPFHIYLTNSNLRGIPYQVGTGTDVYRMLTHGDRLHYRIDGLGAATAAASRFGADDTVRKTLSARFLRDSAGADPDWQDLGEAALTTAAFPGGLAARRLEAATAEFDGRLWPDFMAGGAAIDPGFPNGFPDPDKTFGFANVDGGMINNDPFEYARFALLDEWTSPSAYNPRGLADADRAVIMISPFPEGAVFDATSRPELGLVSVLSRLVPTLIHQARFKPSQIALAAARDVASRWIIAPRRRDDPNTAASSTAIACGLLGGFGGFLDRRFREHDYQLGMRNCQKFLLDGLVLDGANKAVFGPGGSSGTRPLLRLLGSAQTQIPLPSWPKMSPSDVDAVLRGIRTRANAAFPAVLDTLPTSALVRLLVRLGWLWERTAVFKAIDKAVMDGLYRRDQIGANRR